MAKTVVANGKGYNDDPYNAVSNPYGLAAGGHRQNSNFIQMLLDVLADASASLQDGSASSLTIGTGSKVFTLTNNRPIPAGVYCFAIDNANSSNLMFGQVTAHTTDQLTIDVSLTEGSGTVSDWIIQPTGPRGASAASFASVFSFTSAGGETSFSGLDDLGNTLAYTPGTLTEVYLNGVRLEAADYVATTGTSITGLTALSASDILTVVANTSFDVANTYSQAQTDALFASPPNDIGSSTPSAGSFTSISASQLGAAASSLSLPDAVVLGSTLQTKGYTVAGLPTGTAGMTAHVTDSNATLTAGIGATVVGGGANVVPVFFDGSNWKIG